MTISALAAGVAASGLALQTFSVGLAAYRCRRATSRLAAPAGAPPVSLVQPLCGVEAFSKETLASVFALDYPEYELLFCLADPADPIAPLVRRAIVANPKVPARLLIGDDRVSGNPKLNNVVKGWKAARHPWVVIADSNVLAPPDYIQRLMARWRPDTGIVCAPPIGVRPETFAAEFECAFLNTYEARWQYAAEMLGFGFAQGKTMLWRRDVLEAGGGVEALGAEIAEDAAATKLVHRAGLRAHLVEPPFQQPLGARRWRDVWSRQVRWARLRRATFAPYYAPELLASSLCTLIAARHRGAGIGPRRAARGPSRRPRLVRRRSGAGAPRRLAPRVGVGAAWIARDLALPLLWIQGWSRQHFVWRGNVMSVDDDALATDGPGPFPPG